MQLALLGLGTAVPTHTMSQQEALELGKLVCCQTDEQVALLRVLYRRSGVQNRNTCLPHRIALDWARPSESDSNVETLVSAGPTTRERMQYYEEHAPLLAGLSARRAMDQAGVDPASIQHLITVSCTGFTAPGVDVHLMETLGLKRTVERTHVGFMGCHGAINGLRAARGLISAEPDRNALVCAVELCSLHYTFQWDPSRVVGNAIFADGSASMVLGSATRAEQAWQLVGTGSCLFPESRDAIVWKVGDYGFEMGLSPRVPELIKEQLRPWLTAWLETRGLEISRVGSWAIHPGGPRVLTSVEEALGLDREDTAVSREVLAECGNMSSPTVLFLLDRLRRANAARPCVLLGFGPGLVAEAALFR